MPEMLAKGPADYDLRFICPLSFSYPDDYPPQSEAAKEIEIPTDLYPYLQLNPSIYWQQADDLKTWQRRMKRIDFSDQLPCLWVEHRLFGYPQAYWPDEQMTKTLRDLFSGQLNIEHLTQDQIQLLSIAHILILEPALYQQQMELLCQKWKAFLLQNCYLHLPHLINPLQIAALRRFALDRQNLGSLTFSNDQYAERFYCNNEPLINFWQQQLLNFFNRFFPIPVKSTYNLISYYEPGSALKYHTDREPCIWNVTLQLDSAPRSYQTQAWPLWLKAEQGDLPVDLYPGDALIYPGRIMPHWRDALAEGRKETVILFHFVDLDYDGPPI